jgi:hypothetical protein
LQQRASPRIFALQRHIRPSIAQGGIEKHLWEALR